MRLFSALLVGFLLFIIGINIERGFIISLVLAIIAGWFTYKYFGNYKTGAKETVAGAVNHAREARNQIASIVDSKDSQYYAKAEEEADSRTYDKGLWSQALVKCNGDESLRKITYIKLRVAQLKRLS